MKYLLFLVVLVFAFIIAVVFLEKPKAPPPPAEVKEEVVEVEKKVEPPPVVAPEPIKEEPKVKSKEELRRERQQAKKAEQEEERQQKIKEFDAQIEKLKNEQAGIESQVATALAQYNEAREQLPPLEKAASHKEKYWYQVQGGYRANKVLHRGKPPSGRDFTVKYVYQRNEVAVAAYESHKKRVAELKKKYESLKIKKLKVGNDISTAISSKQLWAKQRY